MNEFEEPISKSQKKREADALQHLGMLLTELTESQLAEWPLTDGLYKAIMDAKKIKSHGAKRRQAQLIGKLMRSADHEAIQATWDAFQAENSAQTANFHELEQWRDRLLAGDNQVLTEFVAEYKPESVQQLRQLVKKAKEDIQLQKNSGAAKALFRFLRSCL